MLPRHSLHHSLIRNSRPPLPGGNPLMVNPFMPGGPQPAPSSGPMHPGPSPPGPQQFQHQPESFIQYKPDSKGPEFGPYSDGEADKLSRKSGNNRRGSQPTKAGPEAGMVCRFGHRFSY